MADRVARVTVDWDLIPKGFLPGAVKVPTSGDFIVDKGGSVAKVRLVTASDYYYRVYLTVRKPVTPPVKIFEYNGTRYKLVSVEPEAGFDVPTKNNCVAYVSHHDDYATTMSSDIRVDPGCYDATYDNGRRWLLKLAAQYELRDVVGAGLLRYTIYRLSSGDPVAAFSNVRSAEDHLARLNAQE